MNDLHTHRDREARALTVVVGIVCALGLAGALNPAVEHTIGAVVLGLLALVALTVAGRVGARWVRERREDAADARTAAAWRAAHAPAHTAVSTAARTREG